MRTSNWWRDRTPGYACAQLLLLLLLLLIMLCVLLAMALHPEAAIFLPTSHCIIRWSAVSRPWRDLCPNSLRTSQVGTYPYAFCYM